MLLEYGKNWTLLDFCEWKMLLLLMLCKYVSILQTEISSRPQCLCLCCVSVPSGKISRVSQDTWLCVLSLGCAHVEKMLGITTSLSEELKVQTEAVARRLACKCVCVSRRLWSTKAIKQEVWAFSTETCSFLIKHLWISFRKTFWVQNTKQLS